MGKFKKTGNENILAVFEQQLRLLFYYYLPN